MTPPEQGAAAPSQSDTPWTADELLEKARRLYRTAEMSAGIMRDRRRTGGWEGAERTANAFQRLSDDAREIHDQLALARGGSQ